MATASAQTLSRAPRQDNRRAQLLDATARLFRERGYHATSMRDIAKAVGMLSGSIYYHFDSKEGMLLAVYEEGVRRVAAAVDAAVAGEADPWRRLEAACAAHLGALCSDFAYRLLPGQGIWAREVGQERALVPNGILEAMLEWFSNRWAGGNTSTRTASLNSATNL